MLKWIVLVVIVITGCVYASGWDKVKTWIDDNGYTIADLKDPNGPRLTDVNDITQQDLRGRAKLRQKAVQYLTDKIKAQKLAVLEARAEALQVLLRKNVAGLAKCDVSVLNFNNLRIVIDAGDEPNEPELEAVR